MLRQEQPRPGQRDAGGIRVARDLSLDTSLSSSSELQEYFHVSTWPLINVSCGSFGSLSVKPSALQSSILTFAA